MCMYEAYADLSYKHFKILKEKTGRETVVLFLFIWILSSYRIRLAFPLELPAALLSEGKDC